MKKIYILKINCKGKRTVGKANKGIMYKNYDRFKKLKVKIIKKIKTNKQKTEKERKTEKKKKRETPQICKSPR